MGSLAEEMRLDVAEQDADPERIDELARMLRGELLQLDVDDVWQPSSGPAPPGTRALEIAAVGALLVTFSGAAENVAAVLTAVRGWLARASGPARTVRLEIGGDTIELTSATRREQEQLVSLFVARHTAGG